MNNYKIEILHCQALMSQSKFPKYPHFLVQILLLCLNYLCAFRRNRWDIKFLSPAGLQPTLTNPSSSFTGGNNPYVILTHEQEGGMRMDPVRGDFLRSAHSVPQVSEHVLLCELLCVFII